MSGTTEILVPIDDFKTLITDLIDFDNVTMYACVCEILSVGEDRVHVYLCRFQYLLAYKCTYVFVLYMCVHAYVYVEENGNVHEERICKCSAYK